MATMAATGLIMPAAPRGYYRRPVTTAGQPNYTPWRTSTGLAQPGTQAGDESPPDNTDGGDEMLGSLEVGVIAIPHFPQEAARVGFMHAWEAFPLVQYTQQNPRYVSMLLPAPLGDDLAFGLPDEEYHDELFGISASEGMHYVPFAANGGGIGKQMHNVTQIMSDTEVSETGATGVWSVAGSV